ncbi:uracil permease [Clostridium minihomine]|uniref:uracil permease n=1 Tax=Clostridium minihomine TaxID=2045012 RepID=UPI000C75A17F|nr:uracil permease [Clostridium minihomine]
MSKHIIQTHERPPLKQAIPLSIQHMFAMFGASVLVPTLFGINPAVVLLMNGIGTLFFFWMTQGKAPAYLGSSFAFIGPALIVIARYKDAPGGGFAYAQGGFVAVGMLVTILALIIHKFGSDWIDKLLPPAAMGPIVALIGLELSGTAASTAGILTQTEYVKVKGAAGLFQQVVTEVDPKNVVVFLVTLGIAVFGSILFRNFLSVIPILIAIIGGYLSAYFIGIVDFTPVQQASLFSLPHFQLARFRLDAIVTMLPVALVLVSEHIGHQIVTGKVIEKDLLKDPGLHRSLMGDGISTMASGMLGAVPTTTYGENIGVMAMTRVYSVWVIGGAAVLSIVSSFIGKFSELISTIPGPVIGGISFLLYGMIGASGLRILVDSNVNYGRNRNIIMTSVVFVTGLSGVTLNLGAVQLKGMVLACVVGMMMGLIFHILDRLHLTNDMEDEMEEAASAK